MTKLTALAVKAMTTAGLHGDGNGLYLQVTPPTGKSWVFRFKLGGKSRQMGLGSVNDVTLANARDLAADYRRMARKGVDPILHRQVEKAKAIADAHLNSFKEVAEAYIKEHGEGWRNAKHAQQWKNTLRDYAYPVIGALPVAMIETAHISKILEPIWREKTETASRVRQRIELVLDYAIAKRWRAGPNPALWRGNLKPMFVRKDKIRVVKHHAALDWRQMHGFMAQLEQAEGTSALALRFLVLCANRTGEVTGARWSEIDLDNAVWTIAPERMKAKKEHRIPLTADALAILNQAANLRRTNTGDGYVFPGERGGALSNMAMQMTLRRLRRSDITVHGMRSAFKDWCAETGKPNDLSEAALAHTLGNKVQAAYQRGDLLDRRRRLMEQWATFCGTPPAVGDNVRRLRATAA